MENMGTMELILGFPAANPLSSQSPKPLYATTHFMFLFADIQKEYTFQSEEWVFGKLNELTYNKFWKVMEADFVQVDPPRFVLWYTGDMQYSGKPMSTKLTVTLHQFQNGVKVKATASANKTLLILSSFFVLGLIIQLVRSFSLASILGYLAVLVSFLIWDRYAKASAFKRFEEILS
jgi:hypothetical protein